MGNWNSTALLLRLKRCSRRGMMRGGWQRHLQSKAGFMVAELQVLKQRCAIRPEPRTSASADRVRAISRSQPTSETWSGNLLSERALLIDEGDLQLSLRAVGDGSTYEIQNGQLTLPGLHSELSGDLRLEDGWVNLNVVAATRYDLAMLSKRMFDPLSGLSFSGSGEDIFKLSGDPAAFGVAPAVNASGNRVAASPRLHSRGSCRLGGRNFRDFRLVLAR
jgi:hypothetical protein